MKNKKILLVIIIFVVAAVFVGRIGIKFLSTQKTQQTQETQKTLYWTCAMHPSVHSAKPGKCPICGMELIPVEGVQDKAEEKYYACGINEEGHCPHCDEGKPDANCICGGHSFMIESGNPINCPVCKNPLKEINPETAKAKMGARKIVYYRNPMQPEITSPTPMKDQMGMDYVPVYEYEIQKAPEDAALSVVSRVRLNKQQEALAGIVYDTVWKSSVVKTIRTVGHVAFDPELSVAEEEFFIALETREKVSASSDAGVIKRADDIIDSSKLKLKLLGLGDNEIAELETSRSADSSLILPEDKAWVYADIYESDMAWVKEGLTARLTAIAYPGEEFKGVIKSIGSVLDPDTRSVKVRITTDNPDKKLKPEMYVDVVIESDYLSPDGESEVLVVSKEAVLDTGLRKIVYVKTGEGVYAGRDVKLGPEGNAVINGAELRVYPVLGGLYEGETVITKGNFLIDSQSQLTGGMSALWSGAVEVDKKQ